MKTPAQVAERLLAALETLAARETLWLEAGDGGAAAAAAAQAAPLVAHLATLDAGAIGPAATSRLAAWTQQRQQNRARYAARQDFLRTELARLGAARRRLQDLAPTYGSSQSSRSPRMRLNAAV